MATLLFTHAFNDLFVAIVYCTKTAAFFLSELEAKPMGHEPGLSKIKQIHI